MPHRIPLLTYTSALLVTLAVCGGSPAYAQTPVAPVSQARSQANVVLGDSLQQTNVTVDRLHRVLASLNVERWKAPGDVRQTTQSDVDSMLRDVVETLPTLISNAEADPSKVAPAFSVYRNVDALYDVLLRVSETAQLAGASGDAAMLEDQRSSLESSRTQLGAALLQSAQTQDSELVQMRTAAPRPQPAAAAPTKTVIDDGPTAAKPKTAAKRTHKPAPAPATPQ